MFFFGHCLIFHSFSVQSLYIIIFREVFFLLLSYLTLTCESFKDKKASDSRDQTSVDSTHKQLSSWPLSLSIYCSLKPHQIEGKQQEKKKLCQLTQELDRKSMATGLRKSKVLVQINMYAGRQKSRTTVSVYRDPNTLTMQQKHTWIETFTISRGSFGGFCMKSLNFAPCDCDFSHENSNTLV